VKPLKKHLIIACLNALLLISCQEPLKRQKTQLQKPTTPKVDKQFLFKQKCMICHITKGKTAKTTLAPPFYKIKKRYLQAAINKADFITIMREWVKNPATDNSLLPDAITHFNIMPKLAYSDTDINLIINYIYDTDIPKPKWFEQHEATHNKEHQKEKKPNKILKNID